jgi:hypothetical protein
MDTNKALLICLLLVPAIAFAHGGRTDASGCHKDNKNGGRHCHNSGSTYQSQSTRTPNNSQYTTPQPTHSTNISSAASHTTKPQYLSIRPARTQLKETNTAVENDLVLKIQSALNQLGYVAGEPDGVLGKQTIKAIKHFQVDNEMVVDGKPSYLLLEILLGKVG